MDMFQPGGPLQHGPKVLGSGAGLGDLAADVQLQQDLLAQGLLAGLLVDGLQQADTVHALDDVGAAHHLFHLIGLQVADKMHRLVQIGPGVAVGHQLLHMVLAEQVHRQGRAVPDGVRGAGLAHGAKQNIRRVAPGGFCGLFHAAADFRHRLRHTAGVKGLGHGHIS